MFCKSVGNKRLFSGREWWLETHMVAGRCSPTFVPLLHWPALSAASLHWRLSFCLPQAPLLNHRLQGVAGRCPVLWCRMFFLTWLSERCYFYYKTILSYQLSGRLPGFFSLLWISPEFHILVANLFNGLLLFENIFEKATFWSLGKTPLSRRRCSLWYVD